MAKFKIMMAIALFGFSAFASAALIQGDITFGGTVVTVDKAANSVDINGDIAGVTYADGDFAAAGAMAFVTTATYNDFTYDPLSVAGAYLWQLNGIDFTFNLTEITAVDENPGANGVLTLAGVGIMSSASFDDTEYLWSFSADTTNGSAVIAFSSTNTPVPEPSAILLLGAGLLGLGLTRRIMNKS